MPLHVCYPSYTRFGSRRGSSSDELLHQLDLTTSLPAANYQPVTNSLAFGYGLSLLAHFGRAFLAHPSTLDLRFHPCSMFQCFCEALKGQLAPLRCLSESKRLGPDCGTERGTGYHRL